MTKLYENVKMLCRERGITIGQFEELNGFKHNTVSSWGRSLPTCGKVLTAAHFFDVSVDFLLSNTENRHSHKDQYSPSTIRLLNTSEKLQINDDDADIAIKVLEMLWERDKNREL